MGSNDVTGDRITTKTGDAEARKRFEEGFERIFGKKELLPGYKADLQKSNKERKDFFEGEFK